MVFISDCFRSPYSQNSPWALVYEPDRWTSLIIAFVVRNVSVPYSNTYLTFVLKMRSSVAADIFHDTHTLYKMFNAALVLRISPLSSILTVLPLVLTVPTRKRKSIALFARPIGLILLLLILMGLNLPLPTDKPTLAAAFSKMDVVRVCVSWAMSSTKSRLRLPKCTSLIFFSLVAWRLSFSLRTHFSS